MATRSRASFEKRSRERSRRKKREDKLQRRQERREAKLQGGEEGDVGLDLANQDIDMEGLFGYGGRDTQQDSGDTEETAGDPE